MMNVVVRPIPESYRRIPPKYRPTHPPIFPDSGPEGPSDADKELARELYLLLDEESRAWYGRNGVFAGL